MPNRDQSYLLDILKAAQLVEGCADHEEKAALIEAISLRGNPKNTVQSHGNLHRQCSESHDHANIDKFLYRQFLLSGGRTNHFGNQVEKGFNTRFSLSKALLNIRLNQ